MRRALCVALLLAALPLGVSASGEELTVVISTNAAPFQHLDRKGEFKGISLDILGDVAEQSGLEFRCVTKPADVALKDFIASGQADVVVGVPYNAEFAENNGFILSQPFLSIGSTMFCRRGTDVKDVSLLVAALPRGATEIEGMEAARVDYYTNIEDCIDAVEKGKADFGYGNKYSVDYYFIQNIYRNLVTYPVVSPEKQYCFGFSPRVSPQVIACFNQYIETIDSATLRSYVIESMSEQERRPIANFFRTNVALASVMVGVLAVSLAVLCVVIITNRRIKVKNQLLAEAVAQAERANDAKGRFLSHMSHELRTPMNAIVGITRIAGNHLDDPEKVGECLTKIDLSSRLLLNIINDVLDMSAIESDKLKLAHSEFDLKTVISGIAAIYYPQCTMKGVHFSVLVDLRDEVLVGDSLRVNQILMNLVSNAFKFTEPHGSIKLSICQTIQRDKLQFVRFTVEDTGIGMSEEMCRRLFLPFEQESAETARRHGGSGLGLAITKNLVDMMQGTIKVESEQGRGSTFTVDLPFETTGRSHSGSSEALKNVTALVVDDEGHAREYTAIILDRLGVQYRLAASGEDALRQLGEARSAGQGFDVCFIDWKMPDMSGVELTRRIRESFDRDTIIIIVSAYDLSQVEGEARAAGADLFVPKPLFQSTVFDLLMQLTGGRCHGEPAAVEHFDFTGCRVLLAEDNDLNAEIARELLELVHMQVDRVANGREAVERFAASAPGEYDAVLMDVQMPEMDGYQATRAIRACDHPRAKTVPILAMTANAFTEDVSAALSAGMNGHVSKPIDTQLLYETLRDFMEVK